ncbi:carbohydrate ABC transporter permease [Paenibacillus dendritiformis]|uniref:Binding-protein-dependent transport systems inner membrane component n=1 Tax=Paenibacillus dendritiformis C454 TaxID=1131935 RepID=H3SCL3_9BACL|nr:carbohydrate ABC transporter permease [Paenibacillus dendritiformis]EHQ63116.1 binding-protein-dependent transport systems inner membrane component [Paenibacillus dendritiformis C454]PZM67570.1 carbohydrate ABC transporter permease [Paenibacillus dendritiformis]CAH8771880.1 carbohydrate ABC transporter permease [Paenibacillus dendritiformis]
MEPTLVVERNARRAKSKRFSVSAALMYAVLTAWALTTIYPLFWIVNNSFKMSRDVMNNSFGIAWNPVMTNYTNALDRINIGKSYVNSLIMSFGTVFLVLLFGGLAAYILSRFQFRGKRTIYSILYATLLIPAFATVVPVYEILIKTSLVNTYWGLILPQTAGNLTFATLVIAGYMATIPKDLEEAAFIDGCNRWQMFTKVFVPISQPVFASASIFVFMWSYNDLFSAMIFVNKENVRPIVALLNEISSQYGTDFGLMATAVSLTVIPVLIVYLFISKFIQKGLTEGAVKG